MPRKRALVVDDNPEVRSGLQEALTLWGYEAQAAEDAARGMEVVLSLRPDVIVLDGGGDDMPEVIRRIKAEDGRALIVVFSGWAHLEPMVRRAGADAFVLKPDFDGLERILGPRTS